MLIGNLFHTMREIVDQIAEQLPPENPVEKQQLSKVVGELQHISDSILEEWLKFEELFDEKIRPYFSASLPPSPLNNLKESIQSPSLNGDSDFGKGLGYFELGMYGECYPVFKEVVQGEPDSEIARLYLAYTCLLLENREEALKNFQLLERTTENAQIKAICLNALGCISFANQNFYLAGKQFAASLCEDPELFVAHFNRGLVHYIQGEYRQAISSWEEYYTLTQMWDIEVSFYLASSYLKVGEYQKALEIWQLSDLPLKDGQMLIQMGQFFEDHGEYEEALHCYQDILDRKSNDPEAIHGVAWNLWLLTNQTERVIPLLKKALSIAPQNLNILFSLAWIYFHMNQFEQVEQAVEEMLRRDQNYILAISLSLLTALKRGDWQQAETLIESLKEQREEQRRALGDMFMGKLKLSQHKLEEAIESFKKSIWNNPQLKESYLLQGLAYYLNREPEKAHLLWEQNEIFQRPMKEIKSGLENR